MLLLWRLNGPDLPGIYAARRILSRLENPDDVPISITLSASLKIGTSVGAPNSAKKTAFSDFPVNKKNGS